MASPKLTSEQRSILLEWLAADYDWRLIRVWFKDRSWPELSRNTIAYYRRSRDLGIKNLRAERRSQVLVTGLAVKEERIKRLIENADALDAIKWVPDKNGKLPNEKAWRECLADIAAELGQRKQVIEIESWVDKATKAGVPQDKIDKLKSMFELIATGQAQIVKSDTDGG